MIPFAGPRMLPARALRRRPPRLSERMLLLLAALVGGFALIGAAPGFGQVSIGEALSGGVIVRGRIADLFDDRFLIEDATGRILVDAGKAEKPAGLESGQEVTIEGRLRGRVLEARRITLGGAGAAIPAPATPAPASAASAPATEPPAQPAAPAAPAGSSDPAGAGSLVPPAANGDLARSLMRPADAASIQRTVEAAGFRMAGSPVRHDKHTEIPVRDARGRAWVAWLDRFGRMEEAEIVDYDEARVPSQPAFSIGEVGRFALAEGFSPRAQASARRHHFEILATNARSELVELHIDFAGQVYKIVWLR